MIETLTRLFRRRRRADIFRYKVGRRYRYSDPIVSSMILAEHHEYLPRHLAEARSGDMEAIQICVNAAREAFDAGDLSDTECIKLLFSLELSIMALKQRHHAFCRMVAAHGCDIGNLDPERFAALWFTRHESEVRQAEIHRLGIRASTAELPLGWFAATRDTLDEAQRDHDVHVQSMTQQQSL